MNLSKAIITKRKQANLSQRSFGLGKNQLTEIERGKQVPTLHTLQRICEVLGCKVSELIQLAEIIKN